MNIKTGLYGLGLLIAAGALTISCGGSDGDSDGGGGSSTSTAGSSNAGTSSTAGTNNGTSGSNNGTAGSNSGTGGNGTGGSGNNGGTNNNGGRNNNQGGDDPGPGNNGGDGPGPGIDTCGAEVMDGADCMQGDQACEAANGDLCFCRRQGQQRQWQCAAINGGGGGEGPGGFETDCGANPMAGDDCDGFGLCTGSDSCGCFQGEVVCGMMP